jgi:hypothetical protein
MINFDNYALEALIHCHSKKEDLINPITFEKIISKSCNAQWIPGNTYMVDSIWNNIGLNIKSVNKKFNIKSNIQRFHTIAARIPIINDRKLSDDGLGEQILKTLTEKRQSVIRDLNLELIYDVTILHYKPDNHYKVKIFVSEHPHYENYEWTWKNGYGYIDNFDTWKFRRYFSDYSSHQNCLLIKNDYDLSDSLISLSVPCESFMDITVEEAKKEYGKFEI